MSRAARHSLLTHARLHTWPPHSPWRRWCLLSKPCTLIVRPCLWPSLRMLLQTHGTGEEGLVWGLNLLDQYMYCSLAIVTCYTFRPFGVLYDNN